MFKISLPGYSWTRIFLQNIVKASSRALKLKEELGLCIQYGYLLRIVHFPYMTTELTFHRESKLKAEIEKKPPCLFYDPATNCYFKYTLHPGLIYRREDIGPPPFFEKEQVKIFQHHLRSCIKYLFQKNRINKRWIEDRQIDR